jgi:hypothetical protein
MGRRLGHIVTFTKLRVRQTFTPNGQKGFLSRNKNRLPASYTIGWLVKDGENSTAFLHRSEGRKWHLAVIRCGAIFWSPLDQQRTNGDFRADRLGRE